MKKVMFVASNYGLWAEELQAPWDAIKKAGYSATLATYKGLTPYPLAASLDKNFIDPVQNIATNPPEVVDRVNEILDNGEWDNPLKITDINLDGYAALVVVGGPGASLDIAGNPNLHDVILDAYKRGMIVGGLCYAVAALCFTRDPDDKFHSIVCGKTIAAHPHAWDFYTDMGYDLVRTTPANHGTDLVSPGFVYPLQHMAEDAVGPNGKVEFDLHATHDKPFVRVAGRIVTAQSAESSLAYGNAIVSLLQQS